MNQIKYFCTILVCLLLTSLNLLGQPSQKVIVAYVTSWSSMIPDPAAVTHINYAFAHVNESFNGLRIDNPDRLKAIVDLKKKHQHLKVLLSVGGWGSGRFSEMAADPKTRAQFAQHCQQIAKDFQLDGIDIDWEYPTSQAANISSAPEDTQNYTLLMSDIRKAIGKNKLLTLASAANAKYIDFEAINPVVDFVNIMTYDIATAPQHHAGLYRSPLSGNTTADESVQLHIKAGIPAHKLVLGIPFYGRGTKEFGNFMDYKKIVQLTGFESLWDEQAQAPYLVNAAGEFVCSYETPASIASKCRYILQHQLLGAMYWDYAGDTEEGELRKAVFNGLNQK